LKNERIEGLTRRSALVTLVGAGTALGFGCGSTEEEANTTDGSTDAGNEASKQETGTTSTDASDCAVTPEGEIGPYFADDSEAGFERADLSSNLDGTSTQAGVPLTLHVTVLDAQKSCAPYVGAQVDIWHCNASGVYSDIAAEDTSSEQWLRGYLLTDANGQLTFKTIIPGWYSGRTTHIHLRIRSTYSDASSTSDGANTTQCFFDQKLIDTLYTTVAPYKAKGKNPTTNATDHVYAGEEDGANVLALTGSAAAGYTASVTIRLPITATYDASSMGGAPGGGGAREGGPGGGGPRDAAPLD
jgi:protocatechuate 3,4-dioxygenase beta subunit